MGQSKPFLDAFDQSQIEMIERAIERAWEVVRLTDQIEESEGRKLLALCVMSEARAGEENHVQRVSKAVVNYRVRRAHHASRARKR
jgi:hypothetical protein